MRLLLTQLFCLAFCVSPSLALCNQGLSHLKKIPSTIIVTCASGEIGKAIALTLAHDHNLILAGRNLDKLLQLKGELEKTYDHEYRTAHLDYTSADSIKEIQKQIGDKDELLTGLVLITPRPQFSHDLLQDQSEWLQLFQSAFTGPVDLLRQVLPHMQDKSKIVIIGGITSVQVLPEYGPACVLRRMWTTYSKALSHQLGPRGIHINVLSPGVVLTEFHKNRIAQKAQTQETSYSEQMDKDTAKVPLHRHAEPQEVASAAKFLLSKESDFITGQNLVIDGGLTTSY